MGGTAKAILLVLVAAAAAVAQTPADVRVPYQYFAETGLSYDYFGTTMASSTGFGVRIGQSNAFSVTDIDTPIAQPGTNYATLRTSIEYHVAVQRLWEFFGLGGLGITTNGDTSLASFAGGAGVSFDTGAWLSKGRFNLPIVFEYRIVAITANQVKPTYQFSFRKTF